MPPHPSWIDTRLARTECQCFRRLYSSYDLPETTWSIRERRSEENRLYFFLARRLCRSKLEAAEL